MSKIICDVCGTSFPESATQCPICGCVRSVDAKIVAGSTNEVQDQSVGAYTHVKGGRFSKSNVKKRNKIVVAPVESFEQENQPIKEGGKKDIGIVITTVLLLLAIIAVVVYIAIRFFGPVISTGDADKEQPKDDVAQSATIETTEGTLPTILCTEVVLSKTEITFESKGAALLLNVDLNPAETTDTVTFTSADESIATISNEGKIVAVGRGTTMIVVTCGTASAECKVTCNFTDPTEETTMPDVDVNEAFTLNRQDFTLNTKGQTWKLYTGDIAANQITWTSDDENVATIKDGVVTAVGSGTTRVHGEYGGVKRSCIVRCSSAMGKADSTTATEATSSVNEGKYKISTSDASIKVGETFELTLKDVQGNPMNVSWFASDSAICSISGNNITGREAGTIIVSGSIDGEAYSCIVRVYEN